MTIRGVKRINGAFTEYPLTGDGYAQLPTADLSGGGSQPTGAGLYYIDSAQQAHAMPLLDNNVSGATPFDLEVGSTYNIDIAGSNFTGATAFDFGAGVTINTTTINSTTSATVNITVTTASVKTIQASVFGDAEGSTATVRAWSEVIIPDDDDVLWENETNVLTGVGVVSKNAGAAGWDAAATFDSNILDDEDFELRFTVDASGLNKAIMGLTEAYVSANWTDTKYGLYFGGSTLSVQEVTGGTLGAALGSYTPDDTFTIRRVGSIVTALRGSTLIHTFAGASNEADMIVKASFHTVGFEFNQIKVFKD